MIKVLARDPCAWCKGEQLKDEKTYRKYWNALLADIRGLEEV
jgi:hypothetical protein